VHNPNDGLELYIVADVNYCRAVGSITCLTNELAGVPLFVIEQFWTAITLEVHCSFEYKQNLK
jgi:hypothetical protein